MDEEEMVMDTLEALISVLIYNGFESEIYEFYNALEDSINNDSEHYFKYDKFEDYDINHPLHIFWSTIVMEFGDYGSSPRFGWIDNDNKSLVLFALSSAMKE